MRNLDYHRHVDRSKDATNLSLVEADISGGRITRERIGLIRDHPDATEISISGLTQETFEHFIATYAHQFEVIRFWRCPLVEDLSMIGSLADVRYIVYFWNQRATRLWDLSKTKALKGLAYHGFTRLHDISEIAKTSSLEELQFGDSVWPQYVVNSLSPLQDCSTIRHLSISGKKIVDERIEPLAGLVNLESLDLQDNLFTTEQIAWLKAHLADTVASKHLSAYRRLAFPIAIDGKNKDTSVVGKRKPLLDSEQEKSRLDKYVHQFDAMYHWYLANPEARPEDYRR